MSKARATAPDIGPVPRWALHAALWADRATRLAYPKVRPVLKVLGLVPKVDVKPIPPEVIRFAELMRELNGRHATTLVVDRATWAKMQGYFKHQERADKRIWIDGANLVVRFAEGKDVLRLE